MSLYSSIVLSIHSDFVWDDMTYDGYAEYDGYVFNNNWR